MAPKRILGIIAEYDPFHRGHERHLRLAREAVQPDFTYAVLSGCFKQRGELALLSPYDRARCALACGADAVFALPAAWTLRDAEHYALGAVYLLRGLGITHLAFGAETNRLEMLRRIAETLEAPTEIFQKALRTGLDHGMGYPGAISQAMAKACPEAAGIMDQPNNTLAICYLRAIQKLNAAVEPVLIPRTGGYHEERICPETPSASALRGALMRGDYGHAYEAVPEASRLILRERFLSGRVPREETMDRLLIRRLRTMSREELRALPDVSEGLEDRIREAARQANTRAELITMVSGKRYPRARISRICAWAMLGEKRKALLATPLPDRAVLLGLRRNQEMTALWRDRREMITGKWDDPIDLRAWQLWTQCAGLPDTLPWTEKVIIDFHG